MSNPNARSLPATSAAAARPLLPAFLLGLAFAVAAASGSALLLYTTRGFLRAAGLLVGLALGALAAGAWVSGAASPRLRARWLAAFAVYLAAALAVLAWSLLPALRAWGAANALAMLFMLALPAYTTGLVAGTFRAAPGAGTAALGGGAVGVLLATSTLIPRYPPPVVFAGVAVLVFAALLADWRRGALAGGKMTGQVAIVTGVGGQGQFGYTLARQLADAGWRVLITGRSDAVHELAAELGSGGREVAGARADLLDEQQARSVVDAAVQRYGRLDGLVNVAGGLTLTRRVEDTHLEELQRELDRNLATALVMCRAALPALRASRGAIVNFASPSAWRAPARLAAYSAAKAGVVALTQALAAEERDAGVRVNAVAPGMMDTEQNREEGGEGAGYVSRAAVGDVVAFLLSPAARAVTGETVRALAPGED